MTITDLPVNAKYYKLTKSSINDTLKINEIPQIEAYTIINYWLTQVAKDSRFSIDIRQTENATRLNINFGTILDYDNFLTILIMQ